VGYAWDITISAGTKVEEPKKQTLSLHPGVVTRIGVKFARGCHGMVRVRLTRGGVFQVYPFSAGEWVTGDNEEVWFSYYYDLTDHPRALDFEGCSPGTTYEHTVSVRITVLPKPVASMIPVIELLSKLLVRMGVFG